METNNDKAFRAMPMARALRSKSSPETGSGLSTAIAIAPPHKPILSDDEITYLRLGAGLALKDDKEADAHCLELVMEAAEGGARFAMDAAQKRIEQLEDALSVVASIYESSDIHTVTVGDRASQAYDMRCVARAAITPQV